MGLPGLKLLLLLLVLVFLLVLPLLLLQVVRVPLLRRSPPRSCALRLWLRRLIPLGADQRVLPPFQTGHVPRRAFLWLLPQGRPLVQHYAGLLQGGGVCKREGRAVGWWLWRARWTNSLLIR